MATSAITRTSNKRTNLDAKPATLPIHKPARQPQINDVHRGHSARVCDSAITQAHVPMKAPRVTITSVLILKAFGSMPSAKIPFDGPGTKKKYVDIIGPSKIIPRGKKNSNPLVVLRAILMCSIARWMFSMSAPLVCLAENMNEKN